MSDVFISYARRDIDFVRHLFDQLTTRDRAPQADWQDLPPTSDWLAEIYRGVEATAAAVQVTVEVQIKLVELTTAVVRLGCACRVTVQQR